MFGAGTDTTSHLISISFYYFWKNPEILAKVQEELKREIKSSDSICKESIGKLDYMTAFLKEALRHGSPAGGLFARRALDDHKILDVNIRKHDLVTIMMHPINKNPKYWSEPDNFIPERFLPGGPFQTDAWHKEPYAFIPFSAGQRNCIGQYLAMIEAKVIIAKVLQNFKVEFPEQYVLKMNYTFVYEPLNPLMATFTRL